MKPRSPHILQLSVVVFLIDALVGAGGGALLLEFIADRTVKFLLEDGLSFDGFKLGLEVLRVVSGGVASAAGIGHVGPDVFDLIAGGAPVKVWSVTDSEI